MKRTLLCLAISAGLVSCKKDRPEVETFTVTYSVECRECKVYLDGNQPAPIGDPSKSVDVKGSWTNTVVAPSTKTAQLHVYVSSIDPVQTVKGSIKSGKKSVEMNEQLGSGGKHYNKYISLAL